MFFKFLIDCLELSLARRTIARARSTPLRRARKLNTAEASRPEQRKFLVFSILTLCLDNAAAAPLGRGSKRNGRVRSD